MCIRLGTFFAALLGIVAGPIARGEPAIVNFTGNMILTPTAHLEIEIGGFTPGTQHDQVNVALTAILNGTLDAVPINSFQILPRDTFTVLTFGTRLGDMTLNFANNPLAGLGLEKVYSDHALVLRGTGTDGDANLDGSVDFDDLLILAQHYGNSGSNWLSGDFSRDGVVNFDDLLALAQHYGDHAVTNVPRPTGDIRDPFAAVWSLAQTLVPEPGMLAMISIPVVRRRR